MKPQQKNGPPPKAFDKGAAKKPLIAQDDEADEPATDDEAAEGEAPEAGAPEAGAPSGPAGPPMQGDGSQIRPRLIPGSDASEGEQQASPADQAELDQVIDKAMRMIHGRKSRDAVIKLLHDPSLSVAQTVGRAAFQILMTVSDQKNAVTKEPVPEDILSEALLYVVPELMTVGCVAGVFPFEPNDSDDPGKGDTEFDRQVRLACLEATKLYGEKVLKDPSAQTRTQDAQNEWARQIAREVKDGTAAPQFVKAVQQMQVQRGGGQPQAAAAPAEEPQDVQDDAESQTSGEE